jgi:hypothetical protein
MVSSEGARRAAESVHAADLFVLRRVSAGQFVHFGGSGRGEGWAGIVEVSLDDEAPLADALRTERPVRMNHDDHGLVFGPYYAHNAVIVPVVPDVVVVFGAVEGDLDADDDALAAAAQAAVAAVGPPERVKELADELELLEAVRAAATAVPPARVDEAMHELVKIAAEALSCEVGAAYLADGDRLVVVELGWKLSCSRDQLADALAEALEQGGLPTCVQDATARPLPGALADEPGIRSYYLLELSGLARGVLLVAHTDAAPRGFTLLCRRLGARLAEVGSAGLGVSLTREWMTAEAARLQEAFAELEG